MATTEHPPKESNKEAATDTDGPSVVEPQEYRESKTIEDSTVNHPKYNLSISRNVLLAVGIVLGLSLSFLAGVQYQKVHTVSTASGLRTGDIAGPGDMGMGGRYGMRMGGVGTVTAISSSSITIIQRSFGPDASSSGTSKTYAINSSTKITADGATATTDDIKTGDTVFIRTSGSASTTATEIRVGDMPGPGASTQDSTSTSTDGSNDSSGNASTI